MDPRRFDQLTTALAASGNRRGLLKLLGTLPIVGALAALVDEESAAFGSGAGIGGGHRRRTHRHVHHHDHRDHKHKGKSKHHQAHHHNGCKPDPPETTCAGTCGSVLNNCEEPLECPPCPCAQTCTDGCCNGETCVPDANQTDQMCGFGGNTCHDCGGGQFCSFGNCGCLGAGAECDPNGPEHCCGFESAVCSSGGKCCITDGKFCSTTFRPVCAGTGCCCSGVCLNSVCQSTP